MSANGTIKIACPSCRAKYRIPSGSAGRKLRCKKCDKAFRIAVPRPRDERSEFQPPTEDEILRWLMEGQDEGVPARPRVANAPVKGEGREVERRERPAAKQASPVSETTASAEDSDTGAIVYKVDPAQSKEDGDEVSLSFRKTG